MQLTKQDMNVLAIIISDIQNGYLKGSEELRYDPATLNDLMNRLCKHVDTEAMFEQCGSFILPYETHQGK